MLFAVNYESAAGSGSSSRGYRTLLTSLFHPSRTWTRIPQKHQHRCCGKDYHNSTHTYGLATRSFAARHCNRALSRHCAVDSAFPQAAMSEIAVRRCNFNTVKTTVKQTRMHISIHLALGTQDIVDRHVMTTFISSLLQQ